MNSKNTSVKWRTKVLERLKIILDTIVNDRCDSFSETKNLHKLAPVISVENSENSVKYAIYSIITIITFKRQTDKQNSFYAGTMGFTLEMI